METCDSNKKNCESMIRTNIYNIGCEEQTVRVNDFCDELNILIGRKVFLLLVLDLSESNSINSEINSISESESILYCALVLWVLWNGNVIY